MESVAKRHPRHYPFSAFLWLAALLITVACLGLFAYKRLERIVNTAEHASEPKNNRLLEVRHLISDLYEAENEATQYNIDRTDVHLKNYLSVSADLQPRLEALRNGSGKDMRTRLSAKLGDLGLTKLELLDAQISRDEVNRTDKVLDQLSATLRRSTMPAPVMQPQPRNFAADSAHSATIQPKSSSKDGLHAQGSTEDQKARVRQLLQWMIGSGTKGEAAQQPASATADTAKQIAPIKSQVVQAPPKATAIALPQVIELQLKALQKTEGARYRENLQAELQTTLETQAVSDSIRTVVAGIEQYERSIMASDSQEVASIASEARDWMVGFCVACSCFLTLIALGIVSFVRTTKQQHQSTEAGKAQAEVLADTRARFIATMSHELRTPMHAILGFTDRLLRSPLKPDQASQLHLVKRAADHLHSVANTVLEFSRLEANQVQYERAEFHLGREVGLVLELLQPQFEEKGVRLQFQPWTSTEMVKGDALRLRQVLLNLLNNSLKFTAEGSVTLTIHDVAGKGSAEPRLRFEVKDTGMGIPAERLDAVFNAFEQSDASISRRFGGSGLGLAITKMLVEQQGGAIGIESEHGRGTTIWFELPFGKVTHPVFVPAPQVEASSPSFQGKVVLIADDEPYNRVLLRTILESWKVTCVEAVNGLEAATMAAARQFDYILLDLHMPEMDGWQATRQIRQKGDSTQSPIIILSASTQAEALESSLKAGATMILAKPFREPELLEALRKQRKVEIASRPHNDHATQFSLQTLEQMSGQNPAFVKEMVNLFIESAQSCRRSIHLALETKNLEQIGEAAHKLAAPAKQLKAMNLHRILKAFEEQVGSGVAEDHLGRSVAELDEELRELLPALRASVPS